MKPGIILKSFKARSAEQLVMVTTLPPVARVGHLTSAAASTPGRRLPIQWNETGKSMLVPLQPTKVRDSGFLESLGSLKIERIGTVDPANRIEPRSPRRRSRK
jgi:hypothetical protein